MHRSLRLIRRRLVWCCLCLAVLPLVAALTAGCGGGPAAEPAPAASASQTPPPTAAGTTPAANGNATSPGTQRRSDGTDDRRSKTKWIGDIPYDVFYDQPLVVASEGTGSAPEPLANLAANTDPPTEPATGSEPADGTPLAGTSGEPDWQQLVEADTLNDEVTRLRNSLTANLNTLATYNRNLEAIAGDGTSLAALAAVAERHPGDVSWKSKAKYIRDLAAQVSAHAEGTGREPFDATKEPFEQIIAMLSGGPPPDMAAEDRLPPAAVADRGELMKRIKRSFDFLRADVNTQARFKEIPDDVIREAGVLASFGGLLSSESYDSASEEKYQQFIRAFIQADVDAAAAARNDDFAAFESARSRIQKACNDCHAEYAFGDEGF